MQGTAEHRPWHTRVDVCCTCGCGSGLTRPGACAPQVHRAVMQVRGEPRKVVVKVRHPGVAASIALDFRLLKPVAAAASRVPSLKGLSLKESLAQFSANMTAQVGLGAHSAAAHAAPHILLDHHSGGPMCPPYQGSSSACDHLKGRGGHLCVGVPHWGLGLSCALPSEYPRMHMHTGCIPRHAARRLCMHDSVNVCPPGTPRRRICAWRRCTCGASTPTLPACAPPSRRRCPSRAWTLRPSWWRPSKQAWPYV